MTEGFRGPITYRVCKGLHISNPGLLNLFGAVTGGIFGCLKRQRYQEIRNAWYQYNPTSSKQEWQNYLGCYMIYGVLPEEYHCYGFAMLNDKGRSEYLTEFSRHALYDACNKPDDIHIFDNKYETYALYKKYYARDALLVNENTLTSDLARFVKEHKQFICKPLKLYLGMGIEIIDADQYESIEKLLAYLQEKGEAIVEELIQQSSVLSQFHTESVNTIRIPAIRTKDGIRLLDPFFKTGKGKSIVDNGGAGGVIAPVDIETGIITSLGMDEKGNQYLRHPDSGIVFPGFQLPDWIGALKLVEELMKIKPEIRYVGWDLAYTDDGWIVVEGNHEGQLVGQMMVHRGCAKEASQIMERL